MSIETELLKLLQNKNELLNDRFIIAKNALLSSEINIPNVEIVLLKWICSLDEADDPKTSWNFCLELLSAKDFLNINITTLKDDDVKQYINILIAKLKCASENTDLEEVILTVCVKSIKVFQNYFRQNIILYFEFLSEIVSNVQRDEFLIKFLASENVFPKKITTRHDFPQKFFSDFVKKIVNILDKNFENDGLVFQSCSKLLQRFIFDKRIKLFEEILQSFYGNQNSVLLSEEAENYKFIIDDQTNDTILQKLILSSFCGSYQKNFSICYKMFGLIVAKLGFSIQKDLHLNYKPERTCKLENSLNTISSLLKTIEHLQIIVEFELGSLTFPKFLQKLLLSVINYTKDYPRKKCYYEIINSIVKICPLTVEPLINELLVYIMCSENNQLESSYTEVLLNIFEVFHRLHMIPKLISKLVRVLQPIYYESGEELKEEANIFEFEGKLLKSKLKVEMYVEKDVGKLFPDVVLNYFSFCLNGFASGQVINLYRTFMFHLQELVNKEKLQNIGEKQVAFLEILSTLTCQFLQSVRICEYTVTVSTVEKFYLIMVDHAKILGVLGQFFVMLKHDNKQVEIFLKSSYIWGELLILLKHYSETSDMKISLGKSSNSFCDLTYLHSYLSDESWTLISERIQNFGNDTCKELLFKLCLQKLKASLVFEKAVDDEALSSLMQHFHNLHTFSNVLLKDKFCLGEFTPKLEPEVIEKVCNSLLSDLIDNQLIDKAIIDEVCKSEILMSGIVFSIFTKINKLLKGKQKRSVDGEIKEQGGFSQIFNRIAWNNLQEETYEHLKDLSNAVFDVTRNESTVSINLEKLKQYLVILKQMPLVYLRPIQQTVMFVLFCCLFKDCGNIAGESAKNVKEELTLLITGLLEFKSVTLHKITESDTFTQYIFENFSSHLFKTYVNNCCKSLESAKSLISCIVFLKKQIQRKESLEFSLIFLQTIKKNKNIKDEETNSTLESHKQIMCNYLEEYLLKNDDVAHVQVLATVVSIYLSSADETKLTKLHVIVKKYLCDIFELRLPEQRVGALTLLQIVFLNKNRFVDIMEDKEVFASKVWKYIKTDMTAELFSNLVLEVFQNVKDLQLFENILKELLEQSLDVLKKNESDFSSMVKIWTTIAACNIKSEKCDLLRDTLEEFLNQAFSKCLENKTNSSYNHLMLFEIALLENKQLLLTHTILDIIYSSVTTRMRTENNFLEDFKYSIKLMDTMLKDRLALVPERLPLYLQQYRTLVQYICKNANSDLVKSSEHFNEVANCAHLLEKHTAILCGLGKHITDFAMYVVADILKEYETVSLHPAVKMHLNNSLYHFLSVCQKHAVPFLLRNMSEGAGVILKGIYESYRKYHRFTGKV